MANILIAFLLEYYQPPTQDSGLLQQIMRECYLPLGRLLTCDLNPRFSISITNSLVEILEMHGWTDDVLNSLRTAYEAGKIEIVHTGAHHPIFPRLPDHEVKRQIELDINLKESLFGSLHRQGVIAPELCYEDRLLELYKTAGFRWTLIDDKTMHMYGLDVPHRHLNQVDDFAVLMRSSFWSDQIRTRRQNGRHWTGAEFVQHLAREAAESDRDVYKIISLSSETFGHHIQYFQETFLRDMLFALADYPTVRLCTVSDLMNEESLPKVQKTANTASVFTYFPPSSVATDAGSLDRGDPYPHWDSHGNVIHRMLWELTDLILSSCEDIPFLDGQNADLRRLLDRAFFSGQYLSASPWYWDMESIYEGIDLQMRTLYKYCRQTDNAAALSIGTKIYTELVWAIHQEEATRKGKPL